MITILWQRATPQAILGAPNPVFSLDGKAVFVADGWGTDYASCRLRRFNLAAGEEETSALLKDAAYSVVPHSSENLVFAVLGRRVLELNSKSLERVREWKSGIPQYSHRALQCGPYLLLMNWRGPTLTVMNLEQAEARRFRVGSCLSFFPLSNSEALIGSGKEGIVWRYSVASGRPKEELKTKPFLAAAFARTAQHLALALGAPFKISDNRVEHFARFQSLLVFDLKTGKSVQYDLPNAFDFLALSENTDRVLLGDGASVKAYSMSNGKVQQLWSSNLPAGFQLAAVSSDFKTIIGVRRLPPTSSQLLAGSLEFRSVVDAPSL